MKKIILTNLFLTGIILTSCSTPPEKVEKTAENLTEARTDLSKASKEYVTDLESCRKHAIEKANANNQSMIHFKARIEHDKKETKTEYLKKMTDLDKKNSDLKKRMEDYKASGKGDWEKFKTEFNKEMETLNLEFDEMTHKGV